MSASSHTMLRYGFFPGCTLESAAGELAIATRKTCARLGIDLVELEGWTCCGASQIQDVDANVALMLNARNLALAEAAGFDALLTVCNTCTLMLRQAKQRLDRDAALRAKVNEGLAQIGLTYRGSCRVTHYLWALVQDVGLEYLAHQVKTPLSGLTVAPFYGCHILMPSDAMGMEDARNPHSMEQVVECLGATAVSYPERLSCCGFHAIYPAERQAERSCGAICLGARRAQADCIVTPCPLCHIALDMWQADAQRFYEDNISLPIIHLPQLVGLALGFSAREMALNRHIVNATNLFEG